MACSGAVRLPCAAGEMAYWAAAVLLALVVQSRACLVAGMACSGAYWGLSMLAYSTVELGEAKLTSSASHERWWW